MRPVAVEVLVRCAAHYKHFDRNTSYTFHSHSTLKSLSRLLHDRARAAVQRTVGMRLAISRLSAIHTRSTHCRGDAATAHAMSSRQHTPEQRARHAEICRESRKRKREGATMQPRRKLAELKRLEGLDVDDRTEAEKVAVRNHRREEKRKQAAAAPAPQAEEGTAAPPPTRTASPAPAAAAAAAAMLSLSPEVPAPSIPVHPPSLALNTQDLVDILAFNPAAAAAAVAVTEPPASSAAAAPSFLPEPSQLFDTPYDPFAPLHPPSPSPTAAAPAAAPPPLLTSMAAAAAMSSGSKLKSRILAQRAAAQVAEENIRKQAADSDSVELAPGRRPLAEQREAETRRRQEQREQQRPLLRAREWEEIRSRGGLCHNPSCARKCRSQADRRLFQWAHKRGFERRSSSDRRAISTLITEGSNDSLRSSPSCSSYAPPVMSDMTMDSYSSE